MPIDSLSQPARVAVTLTTLTLALAFHRALFAKAAPRPSRTGLFVLLGAVLVAAAFAHLPPLTDTLPITFPIGMALGLAVAIGSLAWPAAREAFDRLDDGSVRILLSFRAIFGAWIFGLAALGQFSPRFALEAGLGDLAVAWIALSMPVRLDEPGPGWARALVHGVGLVDLVNVLVLAVTVVRPFSLAQGNATTVVPLPWVAVPLMFALNAHGVRRAAGKRSAPVGDRPEPAGRVRSALS
jgi:hypothetical protein